MREFLKETDWSILSEDRGLDAKWSYFKNIIISVTDNYVPKSKPGRVQPKWLNNEVYRLIKEKHKSWNKYRRTRLADDWNIYVSIGNRTTYIIRTSKKEYERKIAKGMKANPKCFWNMVREKTKVKTGVSDLETKDGEKITEIDKKAKCFNDYFVSVFTKENLVNIPTFDDKPFGTILESININKVRVNKLLKGLSIDKSPGPDRIHNRVLNETTDLITHPLTTIFNDSMRSGNLPSEWKLADVTPIFKKWKKTDPNNYGPVSLTSPSCKLLETMIRDDIIKHLEEKNLLSKEQHGFRSGHSCNTQLLEVVHDWAEAAELLYPVDIVYLDYQKAFDSVPHERLLNKLYAYGIRGIILTWIRNFLINRTQRVTVCGVSSNQANVTSGIPQGSVLGPLLFLIYVNDLPEVVKSTIKLFADDTKIYRVIKSDRDSAILQNDLLDIMKWSEKWQLPFNLTKCKVMHLGSQNKEFKYNLGERKQNGEQLNLETVTEEKDLGVRFDDKLNFIGHISEVVSKGNQRIGLVRRNFHIIDNEMFLLIYKSLIRPVLEYCNTVWTPIYKKDSRSLEQVQRRATKLVKNIRDCDYPTRLRLLKLPSLVYRRRRAVMLQIFRIFKGIDKLEPDHFFSLIGATRGHPWKIFKPQNKNIIKCNTLASRAVNDWNALSTNTVLAPTLNIFKSSLEDEWKDKPWKYDPDNFY